MDGHTFEHYCAGLLRRNGFHHVEVTRGSGDQGIDILAWKHRKKYGIQCKCYSYYLGNKAIQEAYAGMKFYECDVGRRADQSVFYQLCCCSQEKPTSFSGIGPSSKSSANAKSPAFSIWRDSLGNGWCLALLFSLLHRRPEKSQNFPVLADGIFCILLFLGSAFLFLEKGSIFLSLLSTLLLGLSALTGLYLFNSLGGILLLPVLLFLFSFLRTRKLKLRTHTLRPLPPKAEKD